MGFDNDAVACDTDFGNFALNTTIGWRRGHGSINFTAGIIAGPCYSAGTRNFYVVGFG